MRSCEVSIVIPNWNGIDHLPDCLSSLEKQTFKDFEVIVVDNGSTDDSGSFIKTAFSWVKLIELSENTGFATACNIGIKIAKGRYISVLNNDTEVIPQWLEHLLAAAGRNERIGMVASKILLNPVTREIDSVGMLIYPDGIGRQRGHGEIDNGQFEQEEEVFYPSACAALYSSEMFREIGLFDEDFFAYCEDTDLGLRGRHAGWIAVFAPKAVVYHKYSATGGKYSSFKAMHVERNRLWVAFKNFPLRWLLKMPFYTLLRFIVQGYGSLTGRGSTARLRETLSTRGAVLAVMKAYVDALRGLPLMLRKRKKIKKHITDREFGNLLKKYRISVSELILKD